MQRDKQGKQQMQQEHAQDIEAGRPRVWVPGQGWVAIDPDWDRQEATPSAKDGSAQANGAEQSRGDSFQDKGQGYDADSETDGSEFKGPASDRAEAGSTQTADSEHDEDQKQQSIGERRVSKPEGLSHASSQAAEIATDAGPEGEQHESADAKVSQSEAEMYVQALAEQRDQENACGQNRGGEFNEQQSSDESADVRERGETQEFAGTDAKQQQQSTSKPSEKPTEQEGEPKQRRSHGNLVSL